MKEPLTACMDNVLAWRLGEAANAATRDKKCGDLIDRGLILLRELTARGFDVVVAPTGLAVAIDRPSLHGLILACASHEARDYLLDTMTEPHAAAVIAREVCRITGQDDLIAMVDADTARMAEPPTPPATRKFASVTRTRVAAAPVTIEAEQGLAPTEIETLADALASDLFEAGTHVAEMRLEDSADGPSLYQWRAFCEEPGDGHIAQRRWVGTDPKSIGGPWTRWAAEWHLCTGEMRRLARLRPIAEADSLPDA